MKSERRIRDSEQPPSIRTRIRPEQPPRSPKRKPEDKALKEKRNQAAGQQLKASSVLKREKPITSSGRSAKSSSSTVDKSTTKRPSSSKTGGALF